MAVESRAYLALRAQFAENQREIEARARIRELEADNARLALRLNSKPEPGR